MPGRDKDATWCTLGTLCRERDWSKLRLVVELQNGLRYRIVCPDGTVPPGNVIDWHDPDVMRTLDVAASTVTLLVGVIGNEFDYLTLGIEVLPPTEAAPIPSPAIQRWRKRPPADALEAAAVAVARTFQPDDPPTQSEWWKALNTQLGEPVARKVALHAQTEWAEHLQRKPGQKRNRQS